MGYWSTDGPRGGTPAEEVRKVRTRGKGNVLKEGKKDFRTNGGVATARK